MPFSEVLSHARERRARDLSAHETSLYRLINGRGDGATPGLTLDHYGDFRVLSVREDCPQDTVSAWIQTVAAEKPAGIILKQLSRRVQDSRSSLVWGEAPDPQLCLPEGPATFELHLNEGLQTGLFLDHREGRAWVKGKGEGRRVLNLFAYTASFSVFAALGGATQVTSVDASKRSLTWGRRNMAHSGLDPDRHRWFVNDVQSVLRRAKAGEYDLVILDPPLFGHAGKRRFSLLRDLDALLEAAMRALSPGGEMLFSTHALELSEPGLWQSLEVTAGRLGRRLESRASWGLPSWDHPSDVRSQNDDRGAYLKTLVFKLA